MDKPLWIVVANTSTARIFEKTAQDPNALLELEQLSHPESRMHGRELGDDRPGHSPSGRTVLADRSDPRENEHHKFAQELAHKLRAAAEAHRFRSLALFASSHFLGELRKHLDNELQKRIVASHAVDMTALNTQALNTKLHDEFRL